MKIQFRQQFFSRCIVFGTLTYLEKIIWFLVNIFPKFMRKPFYKLVFAEFGKRVFIDECCYFRYPWKIKIGDDVTINRGCEFYPSMKLSETTITINSGTIIAPNVIFFGAGQAPSDPQNKDVADDILVGRNVYVGGNSIIRYGVTISENSVIGAGSVVVKDVAADTIVAGNPARLIASL